VNLLGAQKPVFLKQSWSLGAKLTPRREVGA
jgi:hypothetical protein